MTRRPTPPLVAPALALSLAVVCMVSAPSAAAQATPDPEGVRDALAARLPAALADYRELLRYPNDAHRPDDVLRLMGHLEGRFAALGFRTERLPTESLPLLLAERGTERGDVPTVLVYLQADGQPVDPSRWSQADPWQPVVKARSPDGDDWEEVPWERVMEAARTPGDGAGGTALDPEWRVFARSASDSKGPIAQFLAAIGLADSLGLEIPLRLKVIVDTEEELGSPHLPAAVERFRDRLAADFMVIFDGPPHASGAPTLVFGARGIATATLTVWGPIAPQHSGHYGNWIPNPAFGLARILATTKDAAGRVTIPGWYDGVDLDPATREALATVPDDEEALRRRLGLAWRDSVAATLQEAIQHPSLNVRGMRAAWIGDEARTIIPSEATAELDVRLVPESDPERLMASLRRHVESLGYLVLDREPTMEERRTHPRIATLASRVAYGAFRTPMDSRPARWLEGAFVELHGEPPIRIRTMGGSIPISPFVRALGVPAVIVPTVNPDNNQHSPDENLRIGDFAEGVRLMLEILTREVPE